MEEDSGVTDEALHRLGQAVVQARHLLGWSTREDFADNIDVSYRVLSDLETGRRRLGQSSYIKVERALLWEPGSIAAVLRGERERPKIAAPKSVAFVDPPHDAAADAAADLFAEWRSLRAQMDDVTLRYARVRRIPYDVALEELAQVEEMMQDVSQGRPWTPPWDPGPEYGPDDDPWNSEYWIEVTEEDAGDALNNPALKGRTMYQHHVRWMQKDFNANE
ncbi:helix-turn-helix domain-containing protein [Tsukamurella tyrosinosolvens]|uniref:helix-turn-helix domain-containing protein n=1 Tax=Tsukamurella tyrosinosolvens TaxID=57704 RepID=UPI002DD44900|nr:helix-turn-helix transcriptional regulator [Tsukamurella tyrosinosolvens]MEC4616194.1 helix-turn-helix transcriptional regulator [Tsukamurella tyrosinosolvens]